MTHAHDALACRRALRLCSRLNATRVRAGEKTQHHGQRGPPLRVKRAGHSAAPRLSAGARAGRHVITCYLAVVFCSIPAGSQLVPCNHPADDQQIASALARIERSVDPCGESAQMIEVLHAVEGCSKAAYQICTSSEIDRNVFDRPLDEHGSALRRTINWNPGLRSELELGCDGNVTKLLLRDPTASLLHELVHAAHDCEGINPGEHEIEAVRIENIYRRAVGLCQRSCYGDDRLPPQLTKDCTPGRCHCSAPSHSPDLLHEATPPPAPNRSPAVL